MKLRIKNLLPYKAPENILIISLRQIGDLLIISPLITKTHETWPKAKIDILGFDHALDILNGHPYIHERVRTTRRPNLKQYWWLLKRLFRRYDLALITQPNDRSHLFGLVAAKQRFGIVPQEKNQRWWKKLMCRHVVNIDYMNQHVVIEKLMLIPNILSQHNYCIRIQPPIDEDLPKDIERLVNQNKKPIIVIHAAPLRAYKRILTSTWHEVIRTLAEKNLIFLTGSSAIHDKQLNQEIISGINPPLLKNIHDVSGQLNFSQTAFLLHQASLYIGVDTSMSHLAAACDTRSIVLFGPTPPTNFGPWPNGFMLSQPYTLQARKQTKGQVTILQGPGDCVPCRMAGCNNDSDSVSNCLYQITVQEILNEALEILPNRPC